jgi:hypothetical protein
MVEEIKISVFLAATLLIDLVVDYAWGQINSGTVYINWQIAFVVFWQRVIPLGVSAAISALIVKWVDSL